MGDSGERMHTANAVYFSIFYCGCKQLKSIHLEIRMQRYEFSGKTQNPGGEKDENELKYSYLVLCRGCAGVV